LNGSKKPTGILVFDLSLRWF